MTPALVANAAAFRDSSISLAPARAVIHSLAKHRKSARLSPIAGYQFNLDAPSSAGASVIFVALQACVG